MRFLRCPGRKRFGSRPGSRNEPDQHSTAISLRIAHHRSTSSVNEASAIETPGLYLPLTASLFSCGFFPAKSGTTRNS